MKASGSTPAASACGATPLSLALAVLLAAGPAAAQEASDAAGLFRTWLPVGVAMLSAGIAAVSLRLAWRSQVFGIAREIAAARRDMRGRQGTVALLAFDNSVARPIGMALDTIEGLTVALGKLRPLPERQRAAALQAYSLDMLVELTHAHRLCQEADGALSLGRSPAFDPALVRCDLDDLLTRAAEDALSGLLSATAPAVDPWRVIVALKIDLRRTLEAERATEAAQWQEALQDDVFLRQAQRLLPGWLRPPLG